MAATVDTSTNAYASAYGFQRKCFHAAGLFWAFYSDGTNAGWEFSADGTTWTGAFTSIGACIYGQRFSVWFDGTYIHYIRWDGAAQNMYYRRGTPVNDGSINWCAVQQTAYEGGIMDEYLYPCITVDTNGYAWIGALYYDGDSRPFVLKNANNDGTWTTDFAYELSAVDDTLWKVCPVSLTDGKVYVIYCRSSQLPLGNLWNGATWAGEENNLADFNIEDGYGFSAVAKADDIEFVYNRDVTYQIRHNTRVWGVGWDAADVLVQDAVTDSCDPALSIDPSANELYCFWTHVTSDHVYYKKYSSGSWGGLVDWIDESTDDIQYDYLISSFYTVYGSYIGLIYVTKTGSPYNVKFAYLSFMAPPTVTTQDATGIGKGAPP